MSIQVGLNAQSRLSLCYRLDVIPQTESYHNSLDSLLQTYLGDNYLFRFIAMPSFESEYAIQIELVEKQYYLKAISFDKNLWYAKDIKEISIDKNFIELETQMAEPILLLSKQFIDNKIDSVSLATALDADLYQFEIKMNESIMCGQIWGPIPDCPLDNMCRLCAHIKDWCLTENNSMMIYNEIDKLILMLSK